MVESVRIESAKIESARDESSRLAARVRDAHLVAIASAFPEHVWDREASARVLETCFPRIPRAEREERIEHAGVVERRRAFAPDAIELRGARELVRSRERLLDASAECARELAGRAARLALDASELPPDAIDTLVVADDARCAGPGLGLRERLELRRDLRSYSLDGRGAASGANALGLAASLAERGGTVLVVVVACAAPAFLAGDEREALLAAATRGDGAAAAVVAPSAHGWRFAAIGSWTAPRAPASDELLARHLPGALVRFLSEHERSLADVGLHVVHGATRATLERYGELFRVHADGLRVSRDALADHGDLGAAALLAMLADASADPRERVGPNEVLAVATGPGAQVEFLLFDRTA
ncbi:MAG: hypothetical protein IT453_06575 [Planctomycetes bacterium]|nr:hypothetical protein [Planctomycetota bacterium]